MKSINVVREFESAGEQQVFSLDEVESLVSQGYDLVPLIEKINQTETAGALYERLRGDTPSFLMESAELEETQGRYSFIGIDPEKVVRLEQAGMLVNGEPHVFDDPYEFVNGLVARRKVAPVKDLPPFYGGAAGLFGYDLTRYREPSIGPAKEDKLGLPELALMIPGVTIVFDHYKQEVSLVKNLEARSDMSADDLKRTYEQAVGHLESVKDRVITSQSAPHQSSGYDELRFSANMKPEEFMLVVEKAKAHIVAGDAFQVVPSQRFTSDRPVGKDFAHAVMQRLKRLNPSRYAFLFEFGDFEVAGCSPEMLVKVVDGQVEHMAIAGTRKRGRNSEEDRLLADDLRSDPKERAEHSMLVDLSRNDVGKVCEPLSVAVETHAAVEHYSHVMHMTSKITGRLRAGKTALDALASIAPAGTLSGAPKIRAMQIIDETEPDKRGFYGGAVGYVTPQGDLNSCIFIRSLLVDKDGFVHVQAGAGIVSDSIPQNELRETEIKAAAPLKAIKEVCHLGRGRQELTQDVSSCAPKAYKKAVRVAKKVLLLDNYDSYTYNLVCFLEAAGARVEVFRNDVNFRELASAQPDFVVVSPGPGRPEEAGLSMRAMRFFPEQGVPSLGVCLGHQALAMAFGGEVVRYEPVHGKTSKIKHDGKMIFKNLPDPLEVMRYHSLIVDGLPAGFVESAHAEEGDRRIMMAIRHQELPVEGVQFHPESFYTQAGHKLIENFLSYNRSQHD